MPNEVNSINRGILQELRGLFVATTVALLEFSVKATQRSDSTLVKWGAFSLWEADCIRLCELRGKAAAVVASGSRVFDLVDVAFPFVDAEFQFCT